LHSTGGLSYDGSATGVIYGFLKSLSGFQDLFNTSNFIFCWDSRTSKRLELYPEYKANRHKNEYTTDEIEFYRAFKKQMKLLRTTYLPTIGFRNVFVQRGYESDDVIARICLHSIVNDNEAVIISSDKDLYQCLEHNVSYYNPKTGKILTMQSFKKQYGIDSQLWGMVKATAGCTTDNVKGIQGVGEKRAIDFLLGRLNPDSKAYKAITSPEGNKICDFNQELVILPMKGTNFFKLKRDNLSEQGWKQVTKLLGMQSIRDRMPFGRKR
jgi:5'-3' exonuclease